ncbi:DegV family protein [Frisingicoccus sp.]|uniref:DegV family protein n=1 Tax=Frisingicoccus sp. TaxID=1918627 RepID=UPI002EA22205|nr:DegV family protein [Frisingicoccus sp.]
MSRIILVAETGSDISKELAAQYNIHIVPMHVSFDSESLDDGAFPVEKIPDFYHQTGRLPKTSGCTPDDFYKAFDELHEKYPDAQILYLAYSAVTTCSYQSGVIASEERDYITIIDTKQVSAGQCNVVIEVAKALQANPDMSMEQAVALTNSLLNRAKMCFLPNNLEFLHAGGRVSNAAFLGSRILNIHPCIEIVDGKLVATKKYRGNMRKVVGRLVKDYAEIYNLDRKNLWIVYVVGINEEVKEAARLAAEECGFENIQWVLAGGVITTHGGPGAIGIAGFSKE